MNKFILTILLVLFSNAAMAEWTLLAEYENEKRYFDKASISRKGNFAKMWELNDYILPKSSRDAVGNAISYLSDVQYFEYDCSGRMERLLSMSLFSENMIKGINVEKYQGTTAWQHIIPESRGENALKIACRKSK